VGTRLLYELVSEGIRMGAKAVSLEVRVSNWGAIRLYSRFGFRPVGTRKGYYQETNEDALVMWTDDVRTPEYRARLQRIMAQAPENIRPQ
jgi:ribosomal-protein-alanine N-acetyltransferase